MRYGFGRIFRVAPAAIPARWLVWTLVALLAVAPLTIVSTTHIFGENSEAGFYEQLQALPPSQPETALRIEILSLKLTLPAGAALGLAVRFVPLLSLRHTRAELVAEASTDRKLAPAYGSRAPPGFAIG